MFKLILHRMSTNSTSLLNFCGDKNWYMTILWLFGNILNNFFQT